MLCGGEEGLDAVVILLPDRIELVIVAARATERYPEKCRPDYIRHFRQDFVADIRFILIAGVLPIRAKPVEAACDEHLVIRGIDLISCELLLYEAVERF